MKLFKISCYSLGAILAITLVVHIFSKKSDLPIIYYASSYPEYSLEELVSTSENIVIGVVELVGDTIMEKMEVSTSLDPSEVDDTIYYPMTPVTVRIEDTLKGTESKEIIYYEEGGITDTYIQLPTGYKMTEGIEVILFLNQDGYGWGNQSIYPIVDNQVLLQESDYDMIPAKERDTMFTKTFKEQYDIEMYNEEDSVSTINLNQFKNIVNSYIK